MKNTFLILCVLGICKISFAQTNTFPLSGNAGIGTTSPAYKLHLLDSSPATPFGIGSQSNASAFSRFFDMSVSGPGPAYSAWAGYELTTGTPTYGGTNNDFVFVTNSPVTSSFNLVSEGLFRFTTYRAAAYSTRMTITNAGNVGIGTISPGAKFVVEGTAAGSGLQDGLVQIRETTAANPSAIGFINSGNTGSYNDLAWIRAVITSGSAKGALSFVTRNSDGTNSDVAERMRITSDGNVGIGTTTPAEKLSVNGKIRANEVKVEITGWPDYVFEPSYHLPDLSQTEQFIQEHKHLPGIPSAKEVEKDGINLGEMNAKLLQKIEELTLYVIELRKEMDELKSKKKL